MKRIKLNMSVLPLLSVILGNQLNTTIKEDEVKNYIKEDPISVSNFIKDNFSAFVNSYNNSDNSDIKWLATEVEKDFEINIISPESSYKGIFLDFDSDNGYSVVGNDYEFISFNIVYLICIWGARKPAVLEKKGDLVYDIC